MNDNTPPIEADDWDRHWAAFDESASRNPAQHYRHRMIVRTLITCRTRRLVDLGSGQGDLLGHAARAFPNSELFGLELSQTGVDKARRQAPGADIRCVNLLERDAVSTISDIKADTAVCSEVLEHLDDPCSFLRTAASALAPGAALIVTVPAGPRSNFDRLIGHRRHCTSSDLRDLLKSAGFIVVDVSRAGFPFFNLYRLVVIARGKRLATDIADGSTSRVAEVVMQVFDVLFRFNLHRSPWGWQLIAIARLPHESKPSLA